MSTRRLPAEWEKHEATLLSFPYEGKDWPGKFHAVKWAFVELIRHVSLYEKVLLVVRSKEQKAVVHDMLNRAHADLKNIQYIISDTNRSWMRDSGPVVVETGNGKREAIEFLFNGWAKYSNYKKDRATPGVVAKTLGIKLTKALYNDKHVVLEGGAIDVNGRGTLVTTEECLMDKKTQVRNPGFSKQDYANVFKEYLGITNTIWLGEGIRGDDTHGHVDDICRFVNKNTVVVCREENKKDPNHKILEANIERLQSARLEDGKKINYVTVPMPDRLDFEDLRLPASYVNFLVTNGCVLVPTFNDCHDHIAVGTIGELFPDREVIGISAIDLIWGLGTLHCLSHEICK